MRALFIYWKVLPDRAAGALAVARALQAGLLNRHPLLDARLYQRAESGAPMVTVMETYTQPGGLDALAVGDITGSGNEALATWCATGRHVEQFDRLDA